MQMKDENTKYVTNKQGYLFNEESNLQNIQDQYVMVHSRILYFYSSGSYLTLAMSKNDISVKVVESSFRKDKKLGAYQTKRFVNFFNLGENAQKKTREESKSVSKTSGGKPNEFFKKDTPLPGPKGWTGPATKGSYLPPRTQRYNPLPTSFTPPPPPPIKEKSEQHEEVVVEKEKVQYKKAKKKTDDQHQIESDSSMEEDASGCSLKDVVVREIDGKYFQLVLDDKFCVTNFEGKFIFAPCGENDKQLFSMVKGRDVIEKIKDKVKETKEKMLIRHVGEINLLKEVEAVPRIEKGKEAPLFADRSMQKMDYFRPITVSQPLAQIPPITKDKKPLETVKHLQPDEFNDETDLKMSSLLSDIKATKLGLIDDDKEDFISRLKSTLSENDLEEHTI
jgi:hypothetical protein